MPGLINNPLIRLITESGGQFDKQVLNRNDYLITKGKTERNIYYVESGTLRVFLTDHAEEHTIRFGYPGTLFTALDSFLTGEPTQYNIQALKKCDLLVMRKSSFMELVGDNAKLAGFYYKMLEQLIVQQMERETDLLTVSPGERYRRVLARSPHLFQHVPHKYIASYLRMTPETLSRLKKS